MAWVVPHSMDILLRAVRQKEQAGSGEPDEPRRGGNWTLVIHTGVKS